MSTTVQFLNLSNLIPLAQADMNADDPFTPVVLQRSQLGSIGFYVDNYGWRYFRYVRNQDGATQGVGQIAARVADITKSSVTAPTTTSVTTSALTASVLTGRVLVDETETPAATAPEGESGIITSNTTTVINIDAKLPFSAAPSTSAHIRVIGTTWHARKAPTSAKARTVLGVVVGATGISDTNCGWLQFQGVCPIVKVDQAAVTVDQAISVSTGVAGTFVSASNTATNVGIGWAMSSPGATNSGIAPAFLSLGSGGSPDN